MFLERLKTFSHKDRPVYEEPETSLIGPICELHFFANGTDGVSLQLTENKRRLQTMGETVYICAADAENQIPELDYCSKEATILRKAILDPNLNADEHELLIQINLQAEVIEQKLGQFFKKNGISIVHVRNITSLPFLHLPAAIAIYNLIKKNPDLGFVLHHHDLNWKGPAAAINQTNYKEIAELANKVMIPDFPNTEHVVISSIAQHELWERRQVKAELIPDGFDFERETYHINEEAFLQEFGLDENDLLVGIMTRVRINKSIELAVQFVEELGKLKQQLIDRPKKR